MRIREAIKAGDTVRFNPSKIRLYQQIYDVTAEDPLRVTYVENRQGRRVLHLQKKGSEMTILAATSAVLLVKSAPTSA